MDDDLNQKFLVHITVNRIALHERVVEEDHLALVRADDHRHASWLFVEAELSHVPTRVGEGHSRSKISTVD